MLAMNLVEKPLLLVTEQTGDECKTEQSFLETSYAEIEELPIVAQLCIMATDELKSILPCSVSLDKLSESILKNWACAPCILLKNNREIIGFYGLTAYKPFYSEDAVLGDYMLYILPKFRNYKSFKKLCVAAKDFANEKQMALDLNFITPAKSSLKARFLKNMGAEVIGVKAVYHGR